MVPVNDRCEGAEALAYVCADGPYVPCGAFEIRGGPVKVFGGSAMVFVASLRPGPFREDRGTRREEPSANCGNPSPTFRGPPLAIAPQPSRNGARERERGNEPAREIKHSRAREKKF